MSLLSINPVPRNKADFWEAFKEIIPEAVRCRIFVAAYKAAARNVREYDRESGGRLRSQAGSYLKAIQDDHLEPALAAWKNMSRIAEALDGFYHHSSDHYIEALPYIEEATHFIFRFQKEIISKLEEILKREDEEYARSELKNLIQVAAGIASDAKSCFDRNVANLEEAVVDSTLLTEEPRKRFVSVVSVDLAQYGRHIEAVYDYAQAEGIFILNQRIREHIDEVLKEQRITNDQVVVLGTGDGALLLFFGSDEQRSLLAQRSFDFATQFLGKIDRANSQMVKDDSRLHFRIGICSSAIKMANTFVRLRTIFECRRGGLALGKATRLQSAANVGEIVICSQTWENLGPEMQSKFGSSTSVQGKQHEATISAHRLQFLPDIGKLT